MTLRGSPIARPPRVRIGDVVGVVAPAGPVAEERLRQGLKVLEGWGLRPRVGPSVLARRGYLAGGDAERARDLAGMIESPEVRAIFCARGGYGTARLLPLVDVDLLRARPKAVIGYSDVTALLGAVVEKAGLVAFHGPMVASDLARGLPSRSTEHLRGLLSGRAGLWSLGVPAAVRPGVAEGPLCGGCLSMVVSTLGTPWSLTTDGAILFLEDAGEPPYRLDRMLTQLRQAGKLETVAGVVFGTMPGCGAPGEAEEVVREVFAGAPYPVGFGLASGHVARDSGEENLTLPLGVHVRYDAQAGRLEALELAVQ